jgi:uncharacterized membrane protein YbhN (UPF0104 family)
MPSTSTTAERVPIGRRFEEGLGRGQAGTTLSQPEMTGDRIDSTDATPRRRRFTWRHALVLGVGIAVVVATFAFILPKIADYRDVWGVVKDLSWPQIALLAGVTLLNLVTFAPPWMAALPGLRLRQAFVVTQASTASTYIAPGGVAVGMGISFAMLRAWGFVGPRSVSRSP